jgi:hypothetical protein
MANTTATNILQQVQTYQLAHLAFLQNENCFVSTANTKFKDFEKLVGNLGDTVTFDKPPRMTSTNSLVANFQPADQRVQTLVCNQPASVSYAFSSNQFIFNVENYMAEFGKAAVEELSAQVEADVAGNCVTNTYRFYGDGVNPINSFTQLANALALFRNYGSAKGEAKCYIADTVTPNIIGSGQNQFTVDRGNRTAHSWELGTFKNSEWYESNLLPVHTAGTEGQNGTVLTVVSVTYNGAQGAIDSITFSGTTNANDPLSVVQYDKFQFQDGVAALPNIRYLTFIGHKPSANPVQFQALANAVSTAGNQVTVFVNPPLQSAATNNQNLTTPIVAGMQCRVLPSHRSGLICAGDPLFLAMPRLPDQSPFYTGNETDPDTGVSVRLYYGALFGQNQMGMVHDCLWGSTLVDEYSMALIFPL